MHFTSLVALAAANVASAAMFTNTSSSAAPQTTDKGLPGMVGPFKLLGCYAASMALPDFKKVASGQTMDLNMCAASCEDQYMAVISTDCYCAKKFDSSSAMMVDAKRCNTPCPGTPGQFCGGSSQSTKKRDIAAGDVVSLYERSGSGTTSIVTVTSTSVGTITSCPPEVTDCPVGHKTWRVMTNTIEVCPTPAPEWHKKKTVCYGDCCAPAHPGHKKHRVICEGDDCHTEECDSDDWYKLVHCKGGKCNYTKCEGDECNRKIVCYNGKCLVEKCYGDECKSNLVCHGNNCKHQKCNGGDCYQTTQCNSNGGNCQVVQPNNNPAPGPKYNAAANSQGNNAPANNGQGNNGQGNNAPANNAQGNNGPAYNAANAAGAPAGSSQPTSGPVIAGAEGIAANLLGVAAGLFFVL